MFVLINMDTLQVVGKHESMVALCYLAEIECAVNASYVFPIDTLNDVSKFTTLELIQLYANLTGHQFNESAGRLVIQNNLFQALHNCDARKLNIEQLKTQALRIPLSAESNYKYVYGSSAPQPCANNEGLFAHATAHTDGLTRHSVQYTQRKTTSLDKGLRDTHSAPTTASEPSVPRGGNKAIIWSVADSMWEDAGKPTDAKVVLQLRKQIMNELEAAYQIKRTSASSELGNWQKLRAPI